VSLYEYVLSRHSRLSSNHLLFTRQAANLRVLRLGLSVLSLWILSVLRLILIVSPVRTFVSLSISNVNEDRNTFYVIDDLLNKSVSRISKNAECPFTSSSCQAFSGRLFHNPILGGWGPLVYLNTLGLKNFSCLDIERSIPSALR